MGIFSSRVWLAEHWDSAAQPSFSRKAAALEPGDADYWEHLGLENEWSVSRAGEGETVADFERAARTDPDSADIWMDAADASEEAGDPASAREGYRNARAAEPHSTEVAWRSASLYLYQGDFSKGYGEIRRAVLAQPWLAASAAAECWQASHDAQAMLREALPAQLPIYDAVLGYFLTRNLLDPALIAWNREIALGMPVRMPQAVPLVDSLISHDRLSDAARVWEQALRISAWPDGAGVAGSLVFNGGFEHEIAGGGFGWREIPTEGVRYSLDNRFARSSLRIEFDGSANLDFQGVYQLVPVEPATRYRFSAWVKTAALSTDEGIRFTLFDPRRPAQTRILTPGMTGTNPWTPVELDYATGPATRLLEIAIRRDYSWKFDNRIRGTAWVGDVALTPIASRGNGRAR